MARTTGAQRAKKKAAKTETPQPKVVGFTIATGGAQAIMDYLCGQPFSEVHALVGILQTAQPVFEDPAEESEPSEG